MVARFFGSSSLLVVVLVCSSTHGQNSPDQQTAQPASAAQAASVLDLSQFPLVDPDGVPGSRVIASQYYSAKGKVKDVANKIRSGLQQAGFKELDGASITDDYASATFEHNGFSVSLSVSPGDKPDVARVAINNHGNVDLAKLPVPAGFKQLYSLPSVVAYLTELDVDEANKECRRLLESQGWEPFGDTSVSFFLRKNAVRLQVMVNQAPAQAGKTAVQISAEQLSADLPIPPDFEWLQYSDSSGGMLFDSRKPQAELVEFFKQALKPLQWEPTTEQPVRIDFRDHLIFRNRDKAMIEIEFYEVDKKTRVDLRYQTPTQVADLEKKVEAQAAEIKQKRDAEMERKKNPPKISISAPANATVAETESKSIEFATASGAAKASVENWIKNQETHGWSKSVTIDTKEAGVFTLKKDEVSLDVSFIDPGVIPGSITISVSGDYQLQLSK